MKSLWTKYSEKPKFDKLTRDIKTDVLIIGGGITGILCAHMLHKANVDFVLVEADEIGKGVTQNTTAKITVQHGLIYDKLIKRYGVEKAKLYYEANKKALDKYREITKSINCDFEEKDSFVYATEDNVKIRKEFEAYKRIGIESEYCESLPLPLTVTGAVKIGNQAQFNPMKFIYAISEELNIFENTKVINIEPHKVLTNNGLITANKIIVATHFPIINKHGLYFMKLYQHRSYVLALENAAEINGMYVDESDKGMSFRNYGDLLLLGGGGHRTGKNGGNWEELREFAKLHFPEAKEKYFWATQDCISLDGIPYIGLYSKNTPDLYVATGFNKWGMTSAMAAAEILRDMITDKKNLYAEVFDPSRSVIQPELCVNIFETAFNLLTPTAPRCPHLGCALKYNKAEHTWDCPCHGSRFNKNGKLIDNPATDDVNLK